MNDPTPLAQARDPATRADRLHTLASSGREPVRLAVAANPSTRRQTIDALLAGAHEARSPHAVTRMAAAVLGNASLPLWLLADPAWLASLEPGSADALARSPALTPLGWHALRTHPDRSVQLTLVWSPAAPPEAWRLFGFATEPDALLAAIEEVPDQTLCTSLIRSFMNHPDVPARLRDDPAWLLRASRWLTDSLACSPTLTPLVWHALRDYPDDMVRASLLTSPAAPADAWRHLGLAGETDALLLRASQEHDDERRAPLIEAIIAHPELPARLRDDPTWLQGEGHRVIDSLIDSPTFTPVLWEALRQHRARFQEREYRPWSNLLKLLRSPVAPPDAWTLLGLPTEGTWDMEPNDNRVDEEGVEAMTSYPIVTAVKELLFGGNELTDRSALALARTTVFPELTCLSLVSNEIGDAGLATLAQSTAFPRLSVLRLPHNPVGDAGLAALARSTAFPHLTELDLQQTRVGDRGVRALLRSIVFPSLARLDLTGTRLSNAGATALARSPLAARLTSLDLSFTRVHGPGVHALMDTRSNLRQLTHLGLDRCQIDDDEVTTLARAPHLATLTDLTLSDNAIADMGLVALAASTTLTSLTSLDLSRNPLGPPGLQALARSTALRRLTRLFLADTRMGDRGVIALARSTTLASLEHLILSDALVGDAGVTALARSPAFPALRELFLSHSATGDAGAIALSRSTTLGRLTHLDLSYTQVTLAGALALTRSPFFPALTSLNVDSTRVSHDDYKVLREAAAPYPHLRIS